ncbi:MAG: DUF6056 family protein [Lachnospiraceae bacterium]|nr:DUF6056 family protein [Lachnospiraceae bacterium]
MKESRNKIWREQIFWRALTLLGLFCLMALFVPYTDDDLRWGCAIGMERLSRGFADYGGRYAGYLIVMAMTRSVVFKTLSMGACLTAVCVLVRALSGWEYADLLTAALVLLSPLSLFSQTVGWVSGFANYVVGLVVILAVWVYLDRFFKQEKKQNSPAAAVALLLTGLAGTLIVEHYTIYLTMLAVCTIAFCLWKERRCFLQLWGYLAGCLAGTAWMFSNSAYRAVAGGSDGYRKLDEGNIVWRLIKGLGRICKFGYFDYRVMHGLLLVMMIACLLVCGKRMGKIQKGLGWLGAAGEGGLILCQTVVLSRMESMPVKGAASWICTACCVLSLGSLAVFVLVLFKESVCFARSLFVLASMVVIDGPFLLAKPITPRVFFGSYVLLGLVLSLWLKGILETAAIQAEKADGKEGILRDALMTPGNGAGNGAAADEGGRAGMRRGERLAAGVLAVLVLGIGLYDTMIYAGISRADRQRLEQIRSLAASGETRIYMETLEHEEYVHDITVSNRNGERGYLAFYGLPEDLTLVSDYTKEK